MPIATEQPFFIPTFLDLLAAFISAATGAVAGIRRGYDYVGVLILAFLVGVGGAVLRDGVFLQRIPVAIKDGNYLIAVLAACVAGAIFVRARREIRIVLVVIDAIGVGAYAMVGTQASLDAGLSALGAGLVGLINGVGGGLLRDIAIREEPMLFQPGEHYAGTAIMGIALFLVLDRLGVSHLIAGTAGVALTAGLRVLSMYFGWRTKAFGLITWTRPASLPSSTPSAQATQPAPPHTPRQ